MNLRRLAQSLALYASRVAVRRVVFILIALAFAYVGIGRADAQTENCHNVAVTVATCVGIEEAHGAANASGAYWVAELQTSGYPNVRQCGPPVNRENAYWQVQVGYGASCAQLRNITRSFQQLCPVGTTWNIELAKCDVPCSQRSSLGGDGWLGGAAGNSLCNDGCEFLSFVQAGEEGMPFPQLEAFPTGEQCDSENYNCLPGWTKTASGQCSPPPQPPCPAGQSRDQATGQCKPRTECPEGMVKDPVTGACKPASNECPAGQVKAPDGSCVEDDNSCPAGTVKGADGTCKKDEDDDGEQDEDDGSFSGGDTCDAPPQCSGDPILCGSARIQWRIDCNTRSNTNVTGGSCDAVPICTGEKCDAVEYAQLIQHWRSACALETLVRDGIGGGDGGGGDDGQPEWTRVDGMTQDPGQGATAGDTDLWRESEINGSSLNTSGFIGGGGSCPGFVGVSGGSALTSGFMANFATPPPMWCEYIGWVYLMVVALATISGVYILAGKVG